MPEGDSLHRAARRLQVLVGERLEVETPHPRAAVKRLPERLDGRRLEQVEAVGKNLLLRFEGGSSSAATCG
jgi:endonuclease VIII